jgi:uncharacterized cupin superfamily protein
MANVVEPEWQPEKHSAAGYEGKFSQIGSNAGTEHLGASLYELPPGNSSAPYHWHAANEEMVIVLSGTPTLRTPDGERELAEGEVVAFRRGEDGAHKLTNGSDAPVRFVVISEMNEPDIAVYPDSAKLMVREQAPGRTATGLREFFRFSDGVDYWHGEVED